MWLLLSACSVLVNCIAGQALEPLVNITQGIVAGSLASDGNYFQFHGIPYADSTSGINRFKAPLPAPTFQATFDASRRDIKCVRALGVGYEGTEDCLVANVFTPTLNSTSQLPVMVWVKGREFDKLYEQEYSFRNFMEKQVVIVSLNYRESILGFLCLGTDTAPGNAGLKDIVAGLRWVQQNIEQFGGNPNDITLFGHGSGAAAVDLVTLSPSANGLVQKAITQSGTALAPWAVSRDNLEYAVQVAEALGHEITNIEDLSNVFTRTSVAALMAVINELDLTDNSLSFAPCLEREDLEGVQPFLVKSPYQIFADGDYVPIPFITGFVDNEGTIRSEEAVDDDWLNKMEESFADFIQPDLKFSTQQEETETAQRIKSYYFGNESIDGSSVNEFIEYNGDTIIMVSSIREARTRALTSTVATYLYQFSYRGTLGEAFGQPLLIDSAAHSEELAYMFHGSQGGENIPERDITIGDILVERWTNFAKTGIPTSESSQVLWRPFTSINAFFLRVLANQEINNNAEATFEISVQNPHPNTITFWDDVYGQHFMDAESRWDLTERNTDDDEPTTIGPEDNVTPAPEGSGDGGGGDGDNGDGDNGDSDNGDSDNGGDDGGDGGAGDNDDGEPDDDSTDSATTAVGYTFLIVSLFSLLNKFHSSQIMLL